MVKIASIATAITLIAIAAVLRSAVEAEVRTLLDRLPEYIVRHAGRILPREARQRWVHEALADLDTEPDRPLWRLSTALRFVMTVRRLRSEVRGAPTLFTFDPPTVPAPPPPEPSPLDKLRKAHRKVLVQEARSHGIPQRYAERYAWDVLYRWELLAEFDLSAEDVHQSFIIELRESYLPYYLRILRLKPCRCHKEKPWSSIR